MAGLLASQLARWRMAAVWPSQLLRLARLPASSASTARPCPTSHPPTGSPQVGKRVLLDSCGGAVTLGACYADDLHLASGV